MFLTKTGRRDDGVAKLVYKGLERAEVWRHPPSAIILGEYFEAFEELNCAQTMYAYAAGLDGHPGRLLALAKKQSLPAEEIDALKNHALPPRRLFPRLDWELLDSVSRQGAANPQRAKSPIK